MKEDIELIALWLMLPCIAPPPCRAACRKYRDAIYQTSGISSLAVISNAFSDPCFLPFLASDRNATALRHPDLS